MYYPGEICAQRVVDTRLDLLVREVLPRPYAPENLAREEIRYGGPDEIYVARSGMQYVYCITGPRSRAMVELICELMYGTHVDNKLRAEPSYTELTYSFFTLSGMEKRWVEVTDFFRLAMFHPRADKWRHVGP